MIASTLLFAAQAMTFTADRIAADNVTKALAASGHVVAVSSPYTLRSEALNRAADGTVRFCYPTYATTCTNELGHTHWNVTGEIEYKADDYVVLRNMWLRFCETPILWLPYMYYPLDTDCGFSWMPGYLHRWGAFLQTRYAYDLVKPSSDLDSSWLKAATRFDLRYKQGLALGEDLEWGLGRFGTGKYNIYYAWDQSDLQKQYGPAGDIDENRYGMTLSHRYEPTERDSIRLRASYMSDWFFRNDFLRRTQFNAKSGFMTYQSNGLFWEHVENSISVGAEASGRLNKFYEMTGRLPEVYFDVNPQPVFGLPVNFESENRVGYLRRDYADYGDWGNVSWMSPYSYWGNRNTWAEYESARFDTYNRLTAPFKVFDDVLSVVPRLAYRGTAWNNSGPTLLSDAERVDNEGDLYRSILEGGATFAGRGTGWINDSWRHMAEPYLDVLAQKAWMFGAGDRPYVFDNLDASVMWEDQFAGRGRNLPYSYYGITPGWRNAWEKADDRGRLRQILDFDAYVALQFNDTDYIGRDESHRLAEVCKPNYGDGKCVTVPGARLRWTPDSDLMLMARAEYNSDDNSLPVADVGFRQKVTNHFSYYAKYALRDFRIWDYSTDMRRYATDIDYNYARIHNAEVGFEHQPIDWLAFGPYIRWDLRENELDCVGAWIDYLTDCLGFRFIVEYENSYCWAGGYEFDEDWSFGFYIYLRAFGPGGAGGFR